MKLAQQFHWFFNSLQVILLSTILLIATSLAAKSASPLAPNLSAKKLLWAGSGCPATVDGGATVLDDGKTISLPLPAFAAKPAVAGGSLKEMRKNCGVSMELDYAKGLEFRVIATEVGLGSKGKSTDGLIRTDLRFQGDSTAIFHDFDVKGPRDSARTEIRLGQTSWSKCGERKPFKVQIVARFNKTPPTAEVAESEITLTGPLNLKLEWRVCK